MAAQGQTDRQPTDVRPPSTGKLIWKLVVGALFVISAFTFVADRDLGPMLTGFVIGAGLIAWGLLQYIAQKKAYDDAAAKRAAEERAAQERIRLEAERKLNAPKLCPACGAPTRGRECEYCGTPLD